ncbi:MAG: hypothetical protein ACJ78Q_07780 [Chloroflexia bacterium]
MKTTNQTRLPPLRFTFYVLRLPSLLWLLTGLAVTAFALRFAMRALGVRDDIPFPGLVYSVTAPVVEFFYRFFPLDARFDHPAIEVASLAAAGAVLAVALAIYVVGLLLLGGNRNGATQG